jgi:hypothetical protein
MPKALLNRIAELALAVAVLALLAVGAFSLRGLSLAGASERWVGHTHEVLEGSRAFSSRPSESNRAPADSL